jgi:4-amino-4-deoxy-L-arabinose transferase-like glycosyltransferase
MSRTGLALLVIFLAAVGVRLAYLASNPHPRYGQWAEGGMAHNIVDDGHWFQINNQTSPFDEQQPTYIPHLIEPANVNLRYADAHPLWIPEIVEPVGESIVLAGLWEIVGSERFLPDQLLRILLDALAALLVYRIAMELFGRRRAALLAGAFYAIYPPIAWQTISPYMDFWAVDLTIAILALQLQAVRSPHRWRWLIACGLLVGFGIYFRPFLLVVSALLAVVLNLDAGWRAAFVRALAVTAIALTLAVPWTIRNYNDFHTFIPFRSGFGQTLWEGLGQLHNDFGATFGGRGPLGAEATVHRERPDLTVESPAWDSFLEHKAIHAIEQHPLFYGELLVYRTVLATLWSFNPSWMHRGVVSVTAYKAGPFAFAIERPLNLLEDILEPVVFLLAMLSLGLTWRRWRKAHIVLIAVVLATILPYISLLVEPRYILPAAFAYLIWIGLGADLLAERLARRVGARRDRALGVGA